MNKRSNTIQWKFLDSGMISRHGNLSWEIGKWQKPINDIVMYSNGYHSSPGIAEAYSWVDGEVLCKVECKGKHIDETTKSVWSNMRVIKAWKWTEETKRKFFIKVMELYIEENPTDKTAKTCLDDIKNGCPLRFGGWGSGSGAGVWFVVLYDVRASSYGTVGFRACHVLNVWLEEDILPTLEEILPEKEPVGNEE